MPRKKYSSFLPNPLFLLVLARADYFLFCKLKRELVSLTMSPGQDQEEEGGGYQEYDNRHLFQRGTGLGKSVFTFTVDMSKKVRKKQTSSPFPEG
jgi:hypothetical protein